MASTNSPLFAGLPPLPQVPGTEPERIALDAFRIAIADQVARSLNLDIAKVYEGVQYGAKGADCNLAIPRFRLKEDAKALAQKVASEFVPNEYIASAEATPGQPFVNFHFHSSTLARLILHQINQLNYLEAPEETPAARIEASTNGSEEAAQPAASTSTAPVLGVNRGYGTNTRGLGKKLLVDFSSPNIAKPFHAGHLRSTIIGMFTANVYTANGWKVTKLNYLGDWGKQYGLLAVGFDRYGNEETLKTDPIKHLFDVYVKINDDAREEVASLIKQKREEKLAAANGEKVMIENDKGEQIELTLDMEVLRAEKEYGEHNSPTHNAARALFRKMEESQPEALAIWKRFRDLSIAKYKEIYARLNIDFDIYWGESQVKPESQKNAVEELKRLDLVYEDKGALLCKLDKKLGKVLIMKGDGATLYMTRDIGGAFERYNDYHFDKSIYVVAKQQDLHFQQLFKILELMKYPWAKDLLHINFGMVLGMSTRKGTVVFLEDILDEARETMHNQMRSNEAKYATIEDPERTSDIIGITAVKIQDMSGKRGNNYEFDWKRMTSFEGDTGPYLQYAHVRLASVERKSAPEVVLPPYAERPSSINTDLIANDPKARDILMMLAIYPDVVKKAMDTLEPSNIVTYLFRLCHAISSAWEVLLVRGQEKDVAVARLWLYASTRDVLASAMKLLSLTPLERM